MIKFKKIYINLSFALISLSAPLTSTSCKNSTKVKSENDSTGKKEEKKEVIKPKKEVVKPKKETLTQEELYFHKYRSDIKEFSGGKLTISAEWYPISLNYNNIGYNLYGLVLPKDRKTHKDLRRVFRDNKNITKVYYLQLAPPVNKKTLIIAWLKLKNKHLVLAQSFLKNLKPTLKFYPDDWFEYSLGSNTSKYSELLSHIQNTLNK